MYANFGENIDYLRLRSINVTVNNSVLLVRHGHISYSTKVLKLVASECKKLPRQATLTVPCTWLYY